MSDSLVKSLSSSVTALLAVNSLNTITIGNLPVIKYVELTENTYIYSDYQTTAILVAKYVGSSGNITIYLNSSGDTYSMAPSDTNIFVQTGMQSFTCVYTDD